MVRRFFTHCRWQARFHSARIAAGVLGVGLIAGLLTFAAAPSAAARTYRWIEPEGGLITDKNNWFPIISIFAPGPGADDSVVYGPDANYTVRFNSAAAGHVTHDRATINQGDVTFDLTRLQLDPWNPNGPFASTSPSTPPSAAGSTPLTSIYELDALAGDSFTVTTTDSADTSVTVRNGEVRAYETRVDSETSSARARLTIDAGGEFTTRSRPLSVAPIWNATVRVENGGQLNTGVATVSENWYHLPHSDGQVVVTGNGSAWNATAVYLGGSEQQSGGDARLTIADAGAVAINGTLTLWDDAHVSLSGGGTLDVGSIEDRWGSLFWSTGTLRIRSQTNQLDAGKLLGQHLAIGPGKTLDHRRVLVVGADPEPGENGSASLRVFGDGSVSIGSGASSDHASLGRAGAAEGTLDITGPDATWLGNVHVGGGDDFLGGRGRLIVSAGATPSGNLDVALNNDAYGEVLLTDPGTHWNASRVGLGRRGNGSQTNATLHIENGAVLSVADFAAALDADAVAEVAVAGPAAELAVQSNFGSAGLGVGGSAQFDVRDGGTLSIVDTRSVVAGGDDSHASFMLQGQTADQPSRWTSNSQVTLADGLRSLATLSVLDGAVAAHSAQVDAATRLDSRAEIHVAGAGSRYEARYPTLGRDGAARLTITDGGVFASEEIYSAVSVDALADITVAGPGSQLLVSDEYDFAELNLADYGTATMTVENRGAVQAGTIRLASGEGVATLNVRGAGSTVVSDQLDLGNMGFGTLHIAEGGYVQNQVARAGRFAGAEGQITVEQPGSRWSVDQLYLGGQNTFAGGMARLDIRDAGHVEVAEQLVVWDDATVQLDDGQLAAASIDHDHGGEFYFDAGRLQVGTFAGELLNAGGTLAPGPAAGITTVSRHYFQLPDAVLEIELGGTDNSGSTAPQYDALHVDAIAALDGTLHVELIDAFTPAVGDLFEIVAAGTARLGTFAQQLLPDLTDGLAWHVEYLPDAVTLEVVQHGDFNADGAVDRQDLVSWQGGFGQPGLGGLTAPAGGRDLLAWQANYSSSVSAAATLAVPEPATLLLLLVGAAALATARRRAATS